MMNIDRRYVEVAGFFKALGHPARLRILAELRHGEACVCHLEALLGKPQAYISQQLAVLRSVGLVHDRREGQYVYYAIADGRVIPLLDEFLGDVAAPHYLSTCRCPTCRAALTMHQGPT
ncbi:MAG: helix-turn-helix transcriptional regulator [Anaerolineae bacterium]|nr:helix-turn-helix transcriptional regulator [Anaerolineae bacterium]